MDFRVDGVNVTAAGRGYVGAPTFPLAVPGTRIGQRFTPEFVADRERHLTAGQRVQVPGSLGVENRVVGGDGIRPVRRDSVVDSGIVEARIGADPVIPVGPGSGQALQHSFVAGGILQVDLRVGADIQGRRVPIPPAAVALHTCQVTLRIRLGGLVEAAQRSVGVKQARHLVVGGKWLVGVPYGQIDAEDDWMLIVAGLYQVNRVVTGRFLPALHPKQR